MFFKSMDPAALTSWYRDVIGLELEDWGGIDPEGTKIELWEPKPMPA
ncbi:MAG: hypothetical protein ACRDGI_01080 [Candidatus Limnocylindrales bacterium]